MVAIFLATLMVVISLTACGSSDSIEKQILGSWVPVDDDEGYFTFYSSGTLTATVSNEATETGTWEIDDNTLIMVLYGDTVSVEITDISSDSMIWLTNGREIELAKMD